MQISSLPARSRRRVAATAVAAVTATTLSLGLGAVSAQAAEPADTSAAWLAGELDGGLLPGPFGSPDHGLSLDAFIAFDDLGVESAAETSILDALADDPTAYVSGEAFGDTGSSYAGATGKLAYAVLRDGRDLSDFGGDDLEARLRSVVVTDGDEAGRGSDISLYGDYSNTIGQSFVARALVAADDPLAASAVDYLLLQQCDSGAFRINLFAEAKADDPATDYDDSVAPVDRACGDATTSGDDVISLDATAFGLQALVEADEAGITGLGDDIDAAADALEAAQQSDGGLEDQGTVNTNTTGMAAWALADAGRVESATKAAEFVLDLTVPADATGKLADEKGAIAYDQDAFDAATADGITSGLRDQWRRATAQAVGALGLIEDAPAGLGVSTSPKGFAGTGTDVEVTVEGLESGEEVTLSLGDDEVATVAADGQGTATTDVTLPDDEGIATITASTEGGRTGSTTLQVLAPATFDVDAPDEVVAGESFDVDVDGLAEGEPYDTTITKSAGPGELAAAAVTGLKAPATPGTYVVTVTSEVPERSGSALVDVVAAAGDPDPGTGTGTGSGTGTGTTDLSALPDAGASYSPLLLALGLAAVGAGAVLVTRRRGVAP